MPVGVAIFVGDPKCLPIWKPYEIQGEKNVKIDTFYSQNAHRPMSYTQDKNSTMETWHESEIHICTL